MPHPRAASALLHYSLILYPALALAAPETEADLNAQLLKELNALESSTWSTVSSLGLLAGYESNPLLSSFSSHGAGLARAELEHFSLVPQWHGLEFIGMLNGSVTRYIGPPKGLSGEQSWFLHGEARAKPFKSTRISVSATTYLADEVLDLSINEATHQVAPLRVWGEKCDLKLRQELPAQFWLEAGPELHHSSFLHYAGDYTEGGANLRLGWDSKSGLSVSLAGLKHRRGYTERTESTAAGRALKDTLLHLTDQSAEALISWKKEWHGTWQLSAKARAGEIKDGASGFYDYRQQHGDIELSYEKDPWKIAVELGGDHYLYSVQTVGMGLVPPQRTRDDRNASLKVERKLTEHSTLSLSFNTERSRSNEENSDYANSSFVLGLQREF